MQCTGGSADAEGRTDAATEGRGSQAVASARNPAASVVFDPILGVLESVEPTDVLNSAAYPLDEYPPTVSDPRRDGLQCNDLTKFMKSHCIAILRMASLKIPHRSKRGGAAPAAPPGAEIRAALARPDRPPAR